MARPSASNGNPRLRRWTAAVLALSLVAQAPAAPAVAGAGARPRHVVVAPRAFHAALADYVAHRSKDAEVELVELERVLAQTPGVDDPEKLKRFLFEAWRARGARWSLLVGDAGVLPVRYMVLDRVTAPAFDIAFYPSDLYFADLAKRDGTFDDWNASRDGIHAHYFGEVHGEKNKDGPINHDGIDYRPEIGVGRWPVRTPEEAARVAAKTIAYERALQAGLEPGLRRAAFVSVDGWIDTRGSMARLAASLPAGWTSVQCASAPAAPENGPPAVVEPAEGSASRPGRVDEADVRALLDEGLGLLVHAGHGWDDGWEHSLSVASIPKLLNGARLPIVFSAGCSTARFATLPPYEAYQDVLGAEHPGTNAGEVFSTFPPPPAPYARGDHDKTGFGERLLRDGDAGAVAYIGCNTGSQPCGLTLLEGFVAALRDAAEPRLGDVWARAVDHYFEKERLATLAPTPDWYPASVFFQGMKFMVFGDPSLRMPRPLAPR